MTTFSRRQFLESVGLAAAVPALDAVAGQGPATPGAVDVEKDVVFGKGGGMDLHCDLYHPATGTSKRAATIHLHGGGFARGSKETLTERIRPFAANGYLAIAAQYRLLGPGHGLPCSRTRRPPSAGLAPTPTGSAQYQGEGIVTRRDTVSSWMSAAEEHPPGDV